MSKAVKFIKSNLFLLSVVIAYLVLTIIRPPLGVLGIKNSGYYIKEMLMIMPVIFVLTALLDTWVPKETIIKFLGREAKTKGMVLSFLLGSISAGPIYAAFPFCVMLHKKGASIRNIIIILSSWAVIKIPMLLNEAKFLGLKFMIVRWIITVIAILIFANITNKIVKDKDLPQRKVKEKSGVTINRDACMGCTICTKKYPQLFQMDSKKATVKEYSDLDMELLDSAIKSCPVKAIEYN
ncbi:ferredoxin [Hydrogenoanaerobacterium saccharovorans]|uniref:Ferredoxin n=1 Tax=Hydrogenoanaerobacterium saccharovorans TaxID=474960 RepID=A0A1H8A0G9_9FIRM|nr:permease [Hydrogenoanaerobacterium saccharovorans]RPF48242.1 ferredoxin [Hydrogenoanaerobacterium saccharovorans]SEM64210.1 Ferredoxin [Hydrogenoanaerobacterium saccharovorans]